MTIGRRWFVVIDHRWGCTSACLVEQHIYLGAGALFVAGLLQPKVGAGIDRLQHDFQSATAALAHVWSKHAMHNRPRPVAIARQHCLARLYDCAFELAAADTAQRLRLADQNPASGFAWGRAPFTANDGQYRRPRLCHGIKRGIDPIARTRCAQDHDRAPAPVVEACLRSACMAKSSASAVAGVSSVGTVL